MGTLTFSSDKSKLDILFFRDFDFELADITLAVSQSDAFAMLDEDKPVAQCLVQQKDSTAQVTHFAYSSDDVAMPMLRDIVAYYREKGLQYLEVGCGNANLSQFTLFQRAGFRVSGVIPDYYVGDNKNVRVENAIPNLDMICFRLNLQEKGFSTLGYNASGVK